MRSCFEVNEDRFICTEEENHPGDHIARGYTGIKAQWPRAIKVLQRSRLQRLVSLSSNGGICITTVARLLDCPEASVRRDIFTLRTQGYYITLEQGQIRNYGKRTALLPTQSEETANV